MRRILIAAGTIFGWKIRPVAVAVLELLEDSNRWSSKGSSKLLHDSGLEILFRAYSIMVFDEFGAHSNFSLYEEALIEGASDDVRAKCEIESAKKIAAGRRYEN